MGSVRLFSTSREGWDVDWFRYPFTLTAMLCYAPVTIYDFFPLDVPTHSIARCRKATLLDCGLPVCSWLQHYKTRTQTRTLLATTISERRPATIWIRCARYRHACCFLSSNNILTLNQQDYFQQAVGQVKRVELSYGPGGVSRGIATVVFHHADGASKAFSELNGLLIDNRAVKVRFLPPPSTLE